MGTMITELFYFIQALYIVFYRSHRKSGHLVGNFFGTETTTGWSDFLEGRCAFLVIPVQYKFKLG